MIRVFNITRPNSKTTGWKVFIDNKGEPKYRVKLDGSNSNIGLNIDEDSYLKLTTQHGVDPYATSKFIAVVKDGVLTPYAVSADANDDMAIVLLNFEADLGTIISDVDMVNANAVAYYVSPDVDSQSISLSAIPLDPRYPMYISIKYGYEGGKSLSSMLITIDGRDRNRENLIDIDNETIHLEGNEIIRRKAIELPKVTLNKYIVEEDKR